MAVSQVKAWLNSRRQSWMALTDSEKMWWRIAAVGTFLRILLTSDLIAQANYAPHDASLYVSRAYHFLDAFEYGGFNGQLFVKLPGYSWLLAFFAFFHIRYEVWSLAIIFGGSLYFSRSLIKLGLNRWVGLFCYIYLLFQPFTSDVGFEVLREKVSASLQLMFIGYLARLLVFRSQKRLPPFKLIWQCSGLFALLRLIREEDRTVMFFYLPLYWFCLIPWVDFAQVNLKLWWRSGLFHSCWQWITLEKNKKPLLMLIFPLFLSFSWDWVGRTFVEFRYGKGILHDMSEGEYPALIAKLRSLEGSDINRNIMIPEENLKRLDELIPKFKILHNSLAQPSALSFACLRFNICSEWTNGWSIFWIKDASVESGLSVNLLENQGLFQELRESIRENCYNGKLKCHSELGGGVLRPFNLKWSSAWVTELMRGTNSTLFPRPFVPVRQADHTSDGHTVMMFRKIAGPTESFSELLTSQWHGQFIPFLNDSRIALSTAYHWVTKPFAGLVLFLFFIIILFGIRLGSFEWQVFSTYMIGLVFIKTYILALVSVTMGFLDERMFITQHLVICTLGFCYFNFIFEKIRTRSATKNGANL